MTWLIIIVILAAAFAPLAYMMPSKRDKALARLRMIARREGLEVDVARLPKLDAEPHERVTAGGVARTAVTECVSYGIRLPKSDGRVVRYRLLYAPGTEWPVRANSHWQLDDSFAGLEQPLVNAAYWGFLEEIEPLLAPDRLGLAITADFVLFYWRERLAEDDKAPADRVANIRLMLNKVAEFHQKACAPGGAAGAPELAD